MERAYSLIINNNTRNLKIAAGWSKYYFDFKSLKILIFRLAHSSSHFQRLLYTNQIGRNQLSNIQESSNK